MKMYLWVGALMDFCPENRGTAFFCDRAILCREMTVEAKTSHMSALQTREDQSTSGFTHFVLPWWHEWIHSQCPAGNCCGWEGLSCCQKSCLQNQMCFTLAKESCEGDVKCHRGCTYHREYLVHDWSRTVTDQGLWLSYTAVQEHSQDWTQYATQLGQHWCDPAMLPEGKPWAHLTCSSRPDWFSSRGWLPCSLASPWWSLFSPAISSPPILVFTLYDLCQQTKQPGLFPEVPLFSVKDRWHF